MSIDTAAMNFINQHNQMKISRTNAALNKYGIDTRAQLQQQNLDLRKRLFDLVQLPESRDRLATSALNREISQYGFDAAQKTSDILSEEFDYQNKVSDIQRQKEKQLEMEADTPIIPKAVRWASRNIFGFTPTVEELYRERLDELGPGPSYDLKGLGPRDIASLQALGIGRNIDESTNVEDLMTIINNYGGPGFRLESGGGLQK